MRSRGCPGAKSHSRGRIQFLLRLRCAGGSWRAAPEVGGAALVGGGHGPRALHAPHGEGVAETLVSHVAAAGHLIVHLVALQDLVEEVYVPGGQLERLDLAKLVRGERGDDLAQRGEGLVERLGALALAHVG